MDREKRIIGTDWMNIVARQHEDWIKIVNAFGEYNYAEDIVQEAYIRLIKYATPHRIIKDDKENFLQIADDTNLDEQEAFHKVCTLVDEVAEEWAWYDRKLFKLYRDTDLSIRKIAAETNISWVSIFNTLKNCKTDVRNKLGETYEDYKNEDYDRV